MISKILFFLSRIYVLNLPNYLIPFMCLNMLKISSSCILALSSSTSFVLYFFFDPFPLYRHSSSLISSSSSPMFFFYLLLGSSFSVFLSHMTTNCAQEKPIFQWPFLMSTTHIYTILGFVCIDLRLKSISLCLCIYELKGGKQADCFVHIYMG